MEFFIKLAFSFAILLIVQLPAAYSQVSSNTTATEQSIVAAILGSSYRKDIRPDDLVIVTMTVSLKQIISLDEKNQIMTTSCNFAQYWVDSRLQWTPGTKNDIEVIMVPAKNIWLPDTMVINSADTDGYLKLNSDFSYAAIKYTGEVYFVLTATSMKTRCGLNMKNYPFDNQTCTIKLTSWSNPKTRLDYEIKNDEIDLSDYTNNSIWDITDTDLKEVSSVDRVQFEDSSNSEIQFIIYLQRKSLYYMMNSVFPCFILNLVTILTFFMPFGNQLGLCMTGFLTFSVYSLRISSDIPVQSDFLPKITIYFLVSICYSLFTMFWFILRNHYISKSDMPQFVHVICSFLQRVFCLCFPAEKQNEKKVSPDDKIKNEMKPKEENSVAMVNDSKTDEVKINMPDVKAEKSKCNFCNRCENCETEFKKDKDKGKKKKDIESKLEALNYFFLILLLLVMFVSQLAIWVTIGT